MKKILPILALLSLIACQPVDPVEKQIDQLIAQMTLDEKIAQMTQLAAGPVTEDMENQVRAGLGSVLNSMGEDANHYQRIAVEESRLGIPMIFARDVIHGYRTIYPIPLGQAATFDLALVEEAARLTAEEAVQAGVRWTFSPMVDVACSRRLWRRYLSHFSDGCSCGAWLSGK